MALYRPSQAVLDRIANCHVVAVVGPTGAGKTTLINAALRHDPSLSLILSDMSRAPRPGEQDGVDANFRSRQEMLERIERQEYVNIADGLNAAGIYATSPHSFPAGGIGIMPLFAEAVPDFRALPLASFRVVYILPSGWDTWQERLAVRMFSQRHLRPRFEEAVRSLTFAIQDEQAVLLINGDLSHAGLQFVRAVRNEMLSAWQSGAKALAAELLSRLQNELKNTK